MSTEAFLLKIVTAAPQATKLDEQLSQLDTDSWGRNCARKNERARRRVDTKRRERRRRAVVKTRYQQATVQSDRKPRTPRYIERPWQMNDICVKRKVTKTFYASWPERSPMHSVRRRRSASAK